jgi:hypothetical protein
MKEVVTIEKNRRELGQSPGWQAQTRSKSLDYPSREGCCVKEVVPIAKGSMRRRNRNCKPQLKRDKEERK